MSITPPTPIKIPPLDPKGVPLNVSGPAFTFRGHYGDTQWEKYRPYMISAASMVAASTAVHPYNTVKVAFQIGNREELSRGRISYLCRLYKHYGPFHIYRGYQSAYWLYLIQSVFRTKLLSHFHPSMVPLSFSKSIEITLLTVLGASLITAPLDLVTTRMQSDPLLPPHFQRKYRSTLSSLTTIAREEGIHTLFRGSLYNTSRIGLYTMLMMSTYPYCQHLIGPEYNDKLYTRVLLFTSLSVVNSFIFHPLDTMKTMVQCSVLRKPTFSNVIRPHIQRYGIPSLYKGFSASLGATTAFPMITYAVVDVLANSKVLQ